MDDYMVVKCRNCGTVYDFGKGAFVEAGMTMAEVKDFEESQGAIVIGTYDVLPEEQEKGSLNPDNVYMAWQSPLSETERDRLLREALRTIEKSLARGQKREWRCCKCNTVQSYREKNAKMLSVITEFVENVLAGQLTVECRFQIADYPKLYDALVGGMKKYYKLSEFEISESIWNSLSGACPQCGHIIDGPKLGALGLMYHSDSPHAEWARISPTGLRFGQGVCPKESCTCKEIILRWHEITEEKPEVREAIEKTDWSKIIACHACGAGNPINATECIKCKNKLFLPEQHVPMKPHVSQKDLEERKARISAIARFRPRTTAVISLDLTQASSKKKWWQKLLIACLIICSVSIVILLLIVGSILVVTNIYKIAVFILAMLLFGGLAFVINYLIENADIREAKRDERNAKQAKKEMGKKQIHLDMEVERITNVIRKKVEKNKPLENILPNIRTKDYEALAKAISTIDFIKDTDKGCLFKNMSPDFISKVLANFSEADEITILWQIEPEKRQDVLFRCSLSKRNRLESVLKESEVSSQESNDSEGDLNADKSRDKMDLFDNKKKVDILPVMKSSVPEFIEVSDPWLVGGTGPFILEKKPDINAILSAPIPKTPKPEAQWNEVFVRSPKETREYLAMAYIRHPDPDVRRATVRYVGSQPRAELMVGLVLAQRLACDLFEDIRCLAAEAIWKRGTAELQETTKYLAGNDEYPGDDNNGCIVSRDDVRAGLQILYAANPEGKEDFRDALLYAWCWQDERLADLCGSLVRLWCEQKTFLGEQLKTSTREIGAKLHSIGGLDVMKLMFEPLTLLVGSEAASELNFAWSGIGGWQP